MTSLDQSIFDAARRQGFSDTSAKLVVAQARLESADYSSGVFKKNNNLFGMKYAGQPLASKGSAAPASERACNLQCNGDFYSYYSSPAKSVEDLLTRNYKITRGGVSFNDLATASTPEDFASKLKARKYYGVTAEHYARGLKSKLLRIRVADFIEKNKSMIIFGAGLLLIGTSFLILSKKK